MIFYFFNDSVKKFDQLAKKIKRRQIYLSSIKTKVTVKFPKKKEEEKKKLIPPPPPAENRLGAERVKGTGLSL